MTNNNYRQLSIKIKSAREARGLTQRELAELAGLSSGYLGMVEANKLTPSVKSLAKLAMVLKLDTGFFLENTKCSDEQLLNARLTEHLNNRQLTLYTTQFGITDLLEDYKNILDPLA